MGIDVLVVGALHLDVVVDAPALPRLDETLIGSAVDYRFGGKGGNQALAAARLGARVGIGGRIGQDRFGTQIAQELTQAGIGTTALRVVDGATGMSVAITDADGNYGAVVVSGVNQTIDAADIAVPEDLKILVLQNEINAGANRAVAAKAGQDTTVILNAAPALSPDHALLQHVGVLVVNRLEAAMLSGQPDHLPDADAALHVLHDNGARAVIITLGADGYSGVTQDGTPFAASGHRVKVTTTHGAGDCFVGALAARLAVGAPLDQAAAFAQAAAALHVSTPVNLRGAITMAVVETFLSS